METLVEEIITEANEKNELDYPDESIILNISQTFWLSGLWSKDQDYWFFNRILFYKSQAFDWDFDGANQADSCWETSF